MPKYLFVYHGGSMPECENGTRMARQDGRPTDVVLDRDQVELIEEVLPTHHRGLSSSMVISGITLLE